MFAYNTEQTFLFGGEQHENQQDKQSIIMRFVLPEQRELYLEMKEDEKLVPID